jgi:hypothetical protein
LAPFSSQLPPAVSANAAATTIGDLALGERRQETRCRPAFGGNSQQQEIAGLEGIRIETAVTVPITRVVGAASASLPLVRDIDDRVDLLSDIGNDHAIGRCRRCLQRGDQKGS